MGIFLAVLELVRHYHVQAEQNALFGEIWILSAVEPAAALDPSRIDNYEHPREHKKVSDTFSADDQ